MEVGKDFHLTNNNTASQDTITARLQINELQLYLTLIILSNGLTRGIQKIKGQRAQKFKTV